MPDMVLCMVSIMVRWLSMIAIICGNWTSSCGSSASKLIEVFDEIIHFIADPVDTVQPVKYGSERPADGNIEAVRLPVEVIAERAPEIVEIRNVIPQLFRDFLSVHACGLGQAMSRVDHLLHRVVHVLHQTDRCSHLVGLLQHVVHAVFLKRQI